MARLPFHIKARAPGTRARLATLQTAHGTLDTPVFMPVATHAAVRGQRMDAFAGMGFPIVLGNTFHLMLRPGVEVFERFGGIHRFMGWDRAVLTDSGGFQIFSLPEKRTMREEGAEFTSYIDERRVLLTPERSIEVQRAIGSDIMMALDECVPSTVDEATAAEAVARTQRWAERSLAARGESVQALFGIVQGARFPNLRRQSADGLRALAFDGFAIGGLAVGESRAEREDMTELTAALLPEDRPRYLMGVGTPVDLVEAVHRGVDMFDCILPTALSSKGVAFTWRGRINLRRGAYRLAEGPLDPRCHCPVCAKYSRAYLHHLVKVGESAGWQLLATHNLAFYGALMARIRETIADGSFAAFRAEYREALAASEAEEPVTPPRRSRRRGPPSRLGVFEIVDNRAGSASVRHLPSGEIMHSVNDPAEEAERLYVGQSGLRERLARAEDGELVVWDVGLGAGTNAMAVVQAATEAKRPLHLVSFERDLSAIRLALKHPHRFPQLRHAAPAAIAAVGSWSSGTLRWTLLEGDFRETLSTAPAPDLVFYDPFSLRTDDSLWSQDTFERVHARCEGKATELYTYSRSSKVRTALREAGFRVTAGVGIGPKEETTIATRHVPCPGILR